MWVTNGQEINGMPGTSTARCFCSYASGIVFCTLASNCEKGTMFNFRSGDCDEQSLEGEKTENLKLQWVIVQYDNEEFQGLITEIANEQYQIKCLVPTKIKGMFKFQSVEHAVWYKREKIVSTALAPTLLNSRGFYKF
ncbi:hypothetical protein AVEN_116802-1 [Araneus ventricosus]|uniref:Uncharacterized protein n=1 Tax=Araneus ventricosus TaxID=182803 RepID=A0A4Y2M5G5_ARAVE|nr:hypothetical protein AVEN_116802-1 [Araneus ventricosus]